MVLTYLDCRIRPPLLPVQAAVNATIIPSASAYRLILCSDMHSFSACTDSLTDGVNIDAYDNPIALGNTSTLTSVNH